MATIIAGTNSYVTEAELQTYADDRGITIAAGDLSVLLINGMDYLNAQQWGGTKTDPDQALDFPRNGDTDVPEDIKTAQIRLAILWDQGVNLLAPQERAIKREKVDVIETEYMDNAASVVSYPEIDNLLRPYLGGLGGNQMKVFRT